MLRDVKHNVSDGLLGFATATGDGLHIKLGVSPVVSDTPIIVTGDMDAAKIKSRLGLSPLADAVMDAVQFGASRVSLLPLPRQAPGARSPRRATAAAASRSMALPLTPSRSS